MICHHKLKVTKTLFIFALLLCVAGVANANWKELSLPNRKLAVLTNSPAIRLLNSNNRDRLKALGLQGVPIICEGGEAKLLTRLMDMWMCDTLMEVVVHRYQSMKV